jgi:tryptophan-rich sensory protein
LVLLALVLWMVRSFRPIDPWAAWLNIPYILWLVFALWLNLAFWWLNR